MQLEGARVSHVTFGIGTVTGLTKTMITVLFSQGEKKFLFPDSFSRFLTLEDSAAQAGVDALLAKRRQAVEEKKQAFERKQERLQRIRSIKIAPEAQAAFGFVENTPEAVFSTWSVTSGHYLSGNSKGEPRLPGRLKLNSACLLTYRPKGQSEQARRILGAFMVPDDFDGSLCRDGQIESHERYRIRLSANQVLPFWPYFNVPAAPASWGRTEIKYFANRTMQKILLDMVQLAPEDERSEPEAFYRYFCQVNRLEALPEERGDEEESASLSEQSVV